MSSMVPPTNGKAGAILAPAGKSLLQCLSPEDELEVLIRARYPIIYVVSWEEERVEKQLADIAANRNKKLHVWTYTQGNRAIWG